MESLSVAKIGPPRRFQFMEFHYDSEFPNNSNTSTGEFYFSAPTSPTRSAAILSNFAMSIRAVVPFVWEEKPGTPKKNGDGEERDAEELSETGRDFEFSSGFSLSEGAPNSVGLLSTAEEIFSNGQIRPLRPPPRLHQGFDSDKANRGLKTMASFYVSTPQCPRFPRSPLKEGRRMMVEAFWGLSKRGKHKDFDPFAAVLEKPKEEERLGRSADREEFLWKPKFGRRWSLKDFLFRKGGESYRSHKAAGEATPIYK